MVSFRQCPGLSSSPARRSNWNGVCDSGEDLCVVCWRRRGQWLGPYLHGEHFVRDASQEHQVHPQEFHPARPISRMGTTHRVTTDRSRVTQDAPRHWYDSDLAKILPPSPPQARGQTIKCINRMRHAQCLYAIWRFLTQPTSASVGGSDGVTCLALTLALVAPVPMGRYLRYDDPGLRRAADHGQHLEWIVDEYSGLFASGSPSRR
jgi:hypothetical protein